jgi:hypothetical protein
MKGIGSFKATGPKPHIGWPFPRKARPTRQERKLGTRIADYDKTMRTLPASTPNGSYHKPGSNK